MEQSVFIFGDDFWNTLGIIRSLGEKGIKPNFINLCTEKSWVKYSRYINNYWQVDNFDDGLDILLSNAKEHAKAILLCTSDRITKKLDMKYDELSKYFIMSSCGKKQGEIARLMDKLVMQEYAQKAGLRCINTIKVNLESGEEVPWHKINYPCITKPVDSTTGEKDYIHICHSRDELAQAVKSVKSEIQIQDYIEKDSETLLCGCSTSDGSVTIPGAVLKHHQYPHPFGAAGTAHYGPIPDYIDVSKIVKLIREIKYSGLFSLEFVIQNNVAYFLEINLRNDGHGYAPTACGYNLPFTWMINESTGKPISAESLSPMKMTKFYQIEIPDLLYNLEYDGNIFNWLKTLFKADFHLYYSPRDPKPFIILLSRLILSRTRKIVKRLLKFN